MARKKPQKPLNLGWQCQECKGTHVILEPRFGYACSHCGSFNVIMVPR